MKQLVDRTGISSQPLVFAFLHDLMVETQRSQPFNQIVHILLGSEVLDSPLEGGAELAVLLPDDRDQEFAGDVATHDQDVDIVELSGIEEFSIGALGAVQVGGKVQTGGLLLVLLGKERHGLIS